MQTRTVTELRIEPDGEEVPGAIKQFKIQRREWHETRRRESDRWTMDTTPRPEWVDEARDGRLAIMNSYLKVEDVLTGMTRHQLAKLLADGADILAYIEGED